MSNTLKPYVKTSYIYKTVDDCQINADVYRVEGQDNKPAILWIHGGGLIFGNRRMIPDEQVKLYIEAGYTVIAIDYRLAPETKLKAIIEDVLDAYQWVYQAGPKLFGIDPNNIVLIGHSAGGYLALVAGCFAKPRPKAIISFYGYGDISWYRQPSPHYMKETMLSKHAAYQGVHQSVISDSEFTGFSDKRWLFYLYCRQQGIWIKEITGCDEQDLASTALDAFCPLHHISPSYPPTLLLHGELDTDVPCELSKQMAQALTQNNVAVQMIVLDKLGHMFDIIPDVSLAGAPAGLMHAKVIQAFDV